MHTEAATPGDHTEPLVSQCRQRPPVESATSRTPELAQMFSCYFIINTAINVDISCEKEIILKLLS